MVVARKIPRSVLSVGLEYNFVCNAFRRICTDAETFQVGWHREQGYEGEVGFVVALGSGEPKVGRCKHLHIN